MPERVYTGVGSRSAAADPDVMDLLFRVAAGLASHGWTLRSGGAAGADTAFYEGARSVGGVARIYRPVKRIDEAARGWTAPPQAQAYAIAAAHHPRFASLAPYIQALHARNVHQVLGDDVTDPRPSRFVVCWTPAGRAVGGTRLTLAVAAAYAVDIVNAGNPAHRRRLLDFLGDTIPTVPPSAQQELPL